MKHWCFESSNSQYFACTISTLNRCWLKIDNTTYALLIFTISNWELMKGWCLIDVLKDWFSIDNSTFPQPTIPISNWELMTNWCLIDVEEILIFDWQLKFCSAGRHNFKLTVGEQLMFDWCWRKIDLWLTTQLLLCWPSQFQTESWWQIYVWLMLMKDWFWLTTQLLLSWPSQFQTDIWWKNDVDWCWGKIDFYLRRSHAGQ